MFEVPSKKNIKSVRVTKKTVTDGERPIIAYLSKEEEKEREENSISLIKKEIKG